MDPDSRALVKRWKVHAELLKASTVDLFRELHAPGVPWAYVLDKFAEIDKRLRILHDEVRQAQSDQFRYFLLCPKPRLPPHLQAQDQARGPGADAPLEHLPLFLSPMLLPEMAAADKQLEDAEAEEGGAAEAAASADCNEEGPAAKRLRRHNLEVDDLVEMFQDEAAGMRERFRKRKD